MKYLISESRLDDIVQKFISDNVGKLKSRVFRHPDTEYTRYFGPDRSVVFNVENTKDDGSILYVRSDIFSLIQHMFGLKNQDTAEQFEKFMKKYGWDDFSGYSVFVHDFNSDEPL